ncbi:homeobox protein BEL1 homolog [Rutidosis leptorrhynchoides]|uniref:homeobox protein BEL1 homolog n=1 Tax=Rutidosis leptorrhynchoides TaxID=125765 RepID=UPI003A9982D7
MVEEEKSIKESNMMVGASTGFDPYNNNNNHNHVNSSSTNPNEFFNFEHHSSVSHNSDLFWKHSSSPSSSSKPLIITGTGDFGQFDESSLQRCLLIPCEPNERPSQGLSLSLSSTNPSTIGIQPFELVRPSQDHHHHHHNHNHTHNINTHQGYFGKPLNMHEQHDIMNSVSSSFQHQSAQYMNIRSSRYLTSAQDLLNEFCNLGTNKKDHSKAKAQRTNQWQDHDNVNAGSSNSKPLNSLEFLELQKRKSKLLQMLEEVDRKYHNYCDQMKAVVSSFEAVAGNGAATVYSALASKAMSRHFRCLRDGIVSQIKATKKAMGEKDISAPGATKGETPRLRLLDQTLRQQRAFQQMTMMDSHPWRPQRGLPERSVSILRAWLFEHFLHPYPSDVDKHILARQTGLSRSQVSNWFINARVRLWKPMVEEMYVEETKDNENENIEDSLISDRFNATIDENTTILPMEQKPTVDQLIRRDSDCLSSIINHHDHHTTKNLDNDIQQGYARVSNDPFGVVELDFSTYNHNFGGSSGGGGVSLTLGLQQHADGVGPSGGDGAGEVSLYYPRDHMEDCQTAVQYSSLLEGDQGQNLPYRNLMGAQLLHDLAG